MLPRSVIVAVTLVLLLPPAGGRAQVTGLAGWDIYIDPGHSGTENMGVFNYSEAQKNLRVGLALRDLLLSTTDIDTVYMSRTTDVEQVSLNQRSDHANFVGATWFHSIHSDAGPPSVNRTLLLWGQNGDGTEKVPNGGKAMSDIMVARLTQGMRIGSSGSIGDCSFYGCSINSGPWLSVNRRTSMPSELSEAGFHTNPTQNQRNMNADWKVLEARTFYWSILAFHGIAAPAERIATGIVADFESGLPINGAVVTIGDTTYTTDTFESLFNRYSTDPNQLRNGFYYLDRLPEGALPITVTAPDYRDFVSQLAPADEFFTFVDVALVSTKPPVVVSTTPVEADTSFRILDPIVVNFSRPMDRPTVEAAFQIDPDVPGVLAWASDKNLRFVPDSLPPLTDFVLTIAGSAAGQFGDLLDGNGDGTGGDDFILAFRTGLPDALPPRIVSSHPVHNSTEIDRQSVVTVEYDEELLSSSVRPESFRLLPIAGGADVPGALRHYTVRRQSVIQFFPSEEMTGVEWYRFEIDPGISDPFGNVEENQKRLIFRTRLNTRTQQQDIDNFESGVETNWWVPQRSGSTAGIVTDSTDRFVETSIVNPQSGGSSALAIDYGWDAAASGWLLREYLAQGAPRDVLFDDTFILSAMVFGDGSGNRLRFAVDDNWPIESAQNHEVSPWYTIDWRGWRPVEWDLSTGDVGSWIGDGVLDGTLRFDSIQLTHAPGAAEFGRIVVDDLALSVLAAPVAIEDEAVPDRLILHQAYPNPFNPTTRIEFEIPESGHVRLVVFDVTGRLVMTLANELMAAGVWSRTFDAAGLASGVYLFRLEFKGEARVGRALLIK